MSDSTERLGELLVRLGALNHEQVEKILEYKEQHPDMLFGQIAIQLGYITREVLEKYF